tara:strand:+ start:633 stop:1079 length:447 start_codon:yes stop_codon:yes gene_type:complete
MLKWPAKTEEYVFGDGAEEYFYTLLDNFHENYVDQLMLSGVSDNNSDIESIVFSESEKFNEITFDVIIAGIKLMKPLIKCSLMSGKRLELECQFFDFGVIFDKCNIIMVQNIMDWTSKKNFCCQIWKLKDLCIAEDLFIHEIDMHWSL